MRILLLSSLMTIITKLCGAQKNARKKSCVIWTTSCTTQGSWLYWNWTSGQILCWRTVNFTQSKWSIESGSCVWRTVWTNGIRNKSMFKNHCPMRQKRLINQTDFISSIEKGLLKRSDKVFAPIHAINVLLLQLTFWKIWSICQYLKNFKITTFSKSLVFL